MPSAITIRRALLTDLAYVIDLKERTMGAELDALIEFSPERSAARVSARFSPEHTAIILRDGERIGTYTLHDDGKLEMFYLEPELQGSGIGTAVLGQIIRQTAGSPLHLQVLAGSRARTLYERHGFVFVSTDGIDDELVRPA